MKKTGFTLVETIVVIGVFTILAVGVTTLISHLFIGARDRLASMDNVDYVNTVASNFTNEIRIASTGVTGDYPLFQAGDNQIIFFSKYRQSSNQVARLRYFIATSTLYKGIVAPSGSPQIYNLGTEKVLTVQKNISTSSSPLFYYYDGNYNGSTTPLTQPINVNQVKYVRINLNIFKQDQAKATSTFTVSAGAAIRNLKTNLGN